MATLALASPLSLAETAAEAPPPQSEHPLTINGQRYAVDLDPRTTLLDASLVRRTLRATLAQAAAAAASQ